MPGERVSMRKIRVSGCRKLPEKFPFAHLLPFNIGISGRMIPDFAAISGIWRALGRIVPRHRTRREPRRNAAVLADFAARQRRSTCRSSTRDGSKPLRPQQALGSAYLVAALGRCMASFPTAGAGKNPPDPARQDRAIGTAPLSSPLL
jgi:hypothetical protein